MTTMQDLQFKVDLASLNFKLGKLPEVKLQLDDEEKGENKLEELTKKLLSQKLKVSSNYRYASLESQSNEYVSYFLLKGDVVNGREWGVTTPSIPENISSFKGMPFVITSNEFIPESIYGERFDHPNVLDAPKVGLAREGSVDVNDLNLIKAFQDRFRVGTIDDVITINDTWRAIIRKGKQFVGRQFPPFCSPAIFKHVPAEPEDAIAHWEGLHLAGLTERPAYGNIALYKGACTGTLDSCKNKFRTASLPPKEPCKFMALKKALAVEAIKAAVLISPTNAETNIQNVFRNRKKDPCPQETTDVNGTCMVQTARNKKKAINQRISNLLVALDFEENKHPRDSDGKFSDKEDGDSTKTEPTEKKGVFDVSSYDNNGGKIKVTVEKVTPEFERHVSIARDVWNDIPPEQKTGINEFLIGSTGVGSPQAAGTFNTRNNRVGLHMDNTSVFKDSKDELIKSQFSTILIHEVAHANYHSLPEEQKQQWREEVKDIEPITGYLKKFKDLLESDTREFEIQKARRNNQFLIIEENEKKIKSGDPDLIPELESDILFRKEVIETFREDFVKSKARSEQMLDSFANETHSEFQVLNQGQESFWQSNQESFKKIKPIFDKIFGEKN